ncbi:alpha-ketoglutarate-dependent dioxygenase AlkB family protein [Pseudotamlana carrageenivorans]|uniref:Alpha-ketoglutarate-dependent dioxygenase AlkB n=1 Tax=Pseudotamlana carrageenivorans TaxID=2069432 RepID=A0A2I7SGJ7_9FLAO|nr:alpha-ketoglutarate-dependent dioxygenase AlkB [Tamlana carrageenivorans]AUS05031.1 alpha-ketoglutarate-dependent dioxygenase AlkB [Tamlana carrageenivorans]
MDLFNRNPITQIIPFDGDVLYYGKVLSDKKTLYYFERLMESITWEHDNAIIFGKLIVTKRKVAWYGDKPFDYTYSKTTKSALPWTKELLELKAIVEAKSGETYNSCLLNLYHNGSEGMAWHSDAEKDLKKNGAIASLSFGADRKFSFKHKESKQTVSILLEKGSLLIMKADTQTHWLHRLPPTKTVKTPRINLTFRTIVS